MVLFTQSARLALQTDHNKPAVDLGIRTLGSLRTLGILKVARFDNLLFVVLKNLDCLGAPSLADWVRPLLDKDSRLAEGACNALTRPTLFCVVAILANMMRVVGLGWNICIVVAGRVRFGCWSLRYPAVTGCPSMYCNAIQGQPTSQCAWTCRLHKWQLSYSNGRIKEARSAAITRLVKLICDDSEVPRFAAA